MQKKGLGRGLESLLGDMNNDINTLDDVTSTRANASAVNAIQGDEMEVSIDKIDSNPMQPRKDFNEEKLAELAESIEHNGIIQPLIVQKNGERYTIIAGERRYRAARLVGLGAVPVLVRNYTQMQVMEIALVENLQRDDLNPLEESAGIELLISQYNLTQEEVGQRLGKSRTAVTNSLRLLKLPDSIQQVLRSGQISSGHARALLALPETKQQEAVCKEIIQKNLSVRQTENIIKKIKTGKGKRKKIELPPELNEVAQSLQDTFATKVRIQGDLQRGSIRIEYYSEEQLEQLYDELSR